MDYERGYQFQSCSFQLSTQYNKTCEDFTKFCCWGFCALSYACLFQFCHVNLWNYGIRDNLSHTWGIFQNIGLGSGYGLRYVTNFLAVCILHGASTSNKTWAQVKVCKKPMVLHKYFPMGMFEIRGGSGHVNTIAIVDVIIIFSKKKWFTW